MKISFFLVLMALSLISCAQEKLTFHPVVLHQDYIFEFRLPHIEYNIPVDDGIYLNSILFKAHKSKGVILYLHGNTGNISGWASVAKEYLKNNYDVFMVDYRGFGKSVGCIQDEKILYHDMQKVYDFVHSMYPENKIILLGYSIGTGLAAKIASDNHPKALLLLAPYYSLPDVVKSHVPFILQSWVKFQIPTYQFLEKFSGSVYLFHGKEDTVIYPHSSKKLQTHIKGKSKVLFLDNQGHNDIESNIEYQKNLKFVLNSLK
ncbi:MAG: alpha/beta fold hydrolase [Neisseriaceae bacterium]|nr:MAG: alpha/beta fold hydrolase [Neisseriaceae bacterium]